MWSAKELVACLSLSVVSLAAPSPVRADCPDQSAFTVPGGVMPQGPWEACPILLRIEGSPVHLGEILCPASRVITPAFGACASTPGSDTYCRHLGNAPVELELCSCGPPFQVTPWFSASTCDCQPPVTISWVQDFGTAPCGP